MVSASPAACRILVAYAQSLPHVCPPYVSLIPSLLLPWALPRLPLSLEIEDPFGRDFNDLPMDSMTRSTLQVRLGVD